MVISEVSVLYLTQDVSFKFKTGVSLVEDHQNGQGIEGFTLGGEAESCSTWRRLFGDLIVGGHQEDGARLFMVLCNGRTRDNGQKLKQDKFRLDLRKKLFHSEGSQVLEQIVQRSCAVLEGFQDETAYE